MIRDTFFIPINSTSLSHYFSRAIILPSKFYGNKPTDIQSRFENSILASSEKWVVGNDCCVEVVLTEKEAINVIERSKVFYEILTPIPISRVKTINFLTSEQAETTVWNTNSGAAFIPSALIKIDSERLSHTVVVNDIVPADGVASAEVSEKVNRFDVILGGFAFMKVATRSFSNFNDSYFPTLSHFNRLIEEQTNEVSRRYPLNWSSKYSGLFSKGESEWQPWLRYIYQDVNMAVLEDAAFREKINLNVKLGMVDLGSVNSRSHFFEIAVLSLYGPNKPKSVEQLISDMNNGLIPPEKIEDVAVLFGLNNGYSAFRNLYRISNKEFVIKFRLQSSLDYYTIESIFQFVFNGNRNSARFPYLDEWIPRLSERASDGGHSLSFRILDTVVNAKQDERKAPTNYIDKYIEELGMVALRALRSGVSSFIKIDDQAFLRMIKPELSKVLTRVVQDVTILEKNNTARDVDRLRAELSKERQRDSGRNSTEPPKKPNLNPQDETPDLKADIRDEYTDDLSTNLTKLSTQELRSLAKQNKIKDATKKSREELILLISKNPPLL